MASTKFDELTKALATSTSRRQALKIFAGSVMAVAATAFGSSLASAAPSPCSPNPCRPNATCCVVNGNKAECCHAGTVCGKKGCVKP
jgi:hypothetical protein